MTRFLETPLYLFVLCYLLVQAGYFVYKQVTTRLARYRMIKEHGCESPRSLDDPSSIPYLYRLKLIKMVRSAAKDHTLLKSTQRKYQEYGNTHTARVRCIQIIADLKLTVEALPHGHALYR